MNIIFFEKLKKKKIQPMDAPATDEVRLNHCWLIAIYLEFSATCKNHLYLCCTPKHTAYIN